MNRNTPSGKANKALSNLDNFLSEIIIEEDYKCYYKQLTDFSTLDAEIPEPKILDYSPDTSEEITEFAVYTSLFLTWNN